MTGTFPIVRAAAPLFRRLAVILLLLASACRVRPVTLPEGFHPAPAKSAEQVKQFLEKNSDIITVRARAKLSLRKGIQRQQVEQHLVFSRPDRLRVEIFASALNQLLAIIVSSNGKLTGFDSGEKVVYTGDASVVNVRRVLSVPLSPEELMLWFCGRVGIPSAFGKGLRLYSSDTNSEFFGEFDTIERRTISFILREAGGVLRLSNFSVQQDNETMLNSDFSYESSSPLPHEISFSLPAEGVLGKFVVVDAELNPNLAGRPGLFSLALPLGVPVVNLNEEGRPPSKRSDSTR